MVELPGVADKLPENLSLGMRRRVALARAIATSPRYILYDEPTTGLDPITTDVISDLFCDLQKKLKVTSIIVTHDLKTAYKVSDRIAMLYKGQIVEVDTTENFKKSQNTYVRQFIEGVRAE
jgi:phospholipid/cholesterol/gamma-HCH transport system ATP-binding protein